MMRLKHWIDKDQFKTPVKSRLKPTLRTVYSWLWIIFRGSVMTQKTGAQGAGKTLSVIVIGAGMVGVSTAIWLQRAGHKVTLIDRIGPAGGTSYGNAGILASSSVVPVTTPGLIGKAPRMLFDPNQPLFLKWGICPD